MTVAANKGNEVEEQARNMATRFRIPRCILTNAESETTMARTRALPRA